MWVSSFCLINIAAFFQNLYIKNIMASEEEWCECFPIVAHELAIGEPESSFSQQFD
jgi:hypothetical protein